MSRYRIVTTQDGREHVSSIVMSRDEASDFLDVEQDLHESTGWNVISMNNTIFCEKLVGQRKIRRQIQVRAYSPLEDHMSKEVAR